MPHCKTVKHYEDLFAVRRTALLGKPAVPPVRKTRTFTGDVADPIDDWHYTYDSLSRLASIVQPTRDKEPVDVFFVKTGQSLPDWVRPELTTYHYDLVGNLDWQLSDQLLVSTYDGTAEYRELTDYSYGRNKGTQLIYSPSRDKSQGSGPIVSHQRVLPPDPPYIGALPPGPAPPEGDWFTRLQER